MVDVGAQAASRAGARSRGRRCAWRRRRRARLRELPKGDALATAQLAGIMAAKRTSDLIPLCHPLPLTHVDVELDGRRGRASRSPRRRETTAQTGVEMEALIGGERRRADGLRHGEGDRQGHGHLRGRARREDEGAGVKAAVLTVSDRVSRGEARGRERRHARGAARAPTATRSSAGSCPTSATQIAAAIAELADEARARADDRRHRARRRATSRPRRRATVLEREAPGIARGDPRRLDREDAARPALARRRRRRRQRRSSSTCPARPAAAATATRCCGRRSTHALKLLADEETATDHVHT